MVIKLYRNNDDKNVVDKTITNELTFNNAFFKEDSSVINPTIFISRTVDIYSYNYVYIPTFKRYYYISDIVTSQQRYEVSCKVDVLMSFKIEIRKEYVIVDRNALRFNEYLEDGQFKTHQYTHRDTYRFDGGFDSSIQNILLCCVGNSSKSPSISSGQTSGGGSTRPSQTINPEDYEELPKSQKDNDDVYIIQETKQVGSLPEYSDETKYWILTQSQYDALDQSVHENGIMYFISENGTNVKGYRNIFCSKSDYDNLSEQAKNNNIPYYVS